MKGPFLLLTLLLCCLFPAISQDQELHPVGEDYIVVQETPKPLNMREFIEASPYPNKARRKGIEGTVIIRVLVDEEGKYIKHKVLNREKMDPTLVEACEPNVSLLTFSPAIDMEGERLKFWVNIPVAYKLTVGSTSYSAIQMMDLAVNAFHEKKVNEGLQIVELILWEQEQYPGAHILKGAFHYPLDLQEAKASFEEAYELLIQLKNETPSWRYQMTREIVKEEEVLREIEAKTTDRELLASIKVLLAELAFVVEDTEEEEEE